MSEKYIDINTYSCIYMYIYIYLYMYLHIHKYIYKNTHILYTYIYIYIPIKDLTTWHSISEDNTLPGFCTENGV
jgi:hypothetical protein